MAYNQSGRSLSLPIPTDDDIRRQARLDSELQPDPELAEGPASSGKVAMFAIAIAVVLGAVFYGLNNSTGQPGRHHADHLDGAEHRRTRLPRPLRACVT